MSKRLTTKEFIEKATAVHGDKFIYDRVDYVDSRSEVEIFCKAHQGYFFQVSGRHLEGNGCRECGKKIFAKPKTQEQFIEEAIKTHGERYDYSPTHCINSRTKVQIICKKHNHAFLQKPNSHIIGDNGCKYCYSEYVSNEKSYPEEYYIDKIRALNFPLYSIVEINGGDDITMSCEKHGIFTTNFTSLKRCKEHNCPVCMKEKSTQGVKKDTESFIKCAKEVHGEKYNYLKVNYIDHNTNVDISCNTCGETFPQKPKTHLSSKGCPGCWKVRNRGIKINSRISLDEVAKKCNIIFDNTLDFANSECVTSNDKMTVLCKKCGKEFDQYKGHLLRGVGCQRCSKEQKESKPEKIITKLLEERGIIFNKEHMFEDCVYKKRLRFDFYIPSTNTCIEYQGEQHYKPVEMFGGEKAFKLQVEKDKIKKDYCEANNIHLVEVLYSDNIEEVISNTI